MLYFSCKNVDVHGSLNKSNDMWEGFYCESLELELELSVDMTSTSSCVASL